MCRGRITSTHCVIVQKSTGLKKPEFPVTEIKYEVLMCVDYKLFLSSNVEASDHVFNVFTVFPLYSCVYCVMYLCCWDFVCLFSVVNPDAQNGISCNEVRGLLEE